MLSEKLNNAMTASAVRVQTEAAMLKSRVQTAVEEKEFGVPMWFWVVLAAILVFAVIVSNGLAIWRTVVQRGHFTGNWNWAIWNYAVNTECEV